MSIGESSSKKRSTSKHKTLSIFGNKERKLVTFDKWGRIHFPKLIRDLFKDCHFIIEFWEGKIVLDPVKIEDLPNDFEGGDEHEDNRN